MWTVAKYILYAFGAVTVLAIVGFCVVMFMVGRVAKENAAVIDQLCAIQAGTPIEEILPLARKLGVKEEGRHSALGKAIDIRSTDPDTKINETDDSLPGFTNGSIVLGKTVTFPFERHYCSITIENRKVVRTEKRILD